MTLVLIVVFVALVFEYIKGFHDTANSIAMGVSTRALTPRAALTMASIMNLVGGVVGAALAASHGNFGSIIWFTPGKEHWYAPGGVLGKVIIPMVVSHSSDFSSGSSS